MPSLNGAPQSCVIKGCGQRDYDQRDQWLMCDMHFSQWRSHDRGGADGYEERRQDFVDEQSQLFKGQAVMWQAWW